MSVPGNSEHARGRRAEALFRTAGRILMDVGAILAGRSSAGTRERLLHTIDIDFVPRLRDYEGLSHKDESCTAIDSSQKLISFCAELSYRVRTNALERSDQQSFLELWWPFQSGAMLWRDIKLLRDSTGKVRPEFATDEDRHKEDFLEAGRIFFRSVRSSNGKVPTLRELYEFLRNCDSTKHITWEELSEAPHYGPLRKLTQAPGMKQ